MSRISQVSAEEVTNKLVAKIQKEIDAKYNELKEYITPIYEATIPKEVMRQWDRGKMWLRPTESVYLIGMGLTDKYRARSLSKSLPKNSGSSTPEMQLADEQAAVVVKIENAIETLKDRKKRTYNEIKGTILGLGTWKKVAEVLPELKPYIPVQQGNMGLMHVPSAIKEKIQCLVSVEDKKCLKTL